MSERLEITTDTPSGRETTKVVLKDPFVTADGVVGDPGSIIETMGADGGQVSVRRARSKLVFKDA